MVYGDEGLVEHIEESLSENTSSMNTTIEHFREGLIRYRIKLVEDGHGSYYLVEHFSNNPR